MRCLAISHSDKYVPCQFEKLLISDQSGLYHFNSWFINQQNTSDKVPANLRTSTSYTLLPLCWALQRVVPIASHPPIDTLHIFCTMMIKLILFPYNIGVSIFLTTNTTLTIEEGGSVTICASMMDARNRILHSTRIPVVLLLNTVQESAGYSCTYKHNLTFQRTFHSTTCASI